MAPLAAQATSSAQPASAQAASSSAQPGATQTTPAPASTAQNEQLQEVVVTGYRRSLLDATDAKKASVGFSDSIFAQDIGQFPDTNVAESFNRVPGIQIVRDADGEGVNVAIRGLGPDFTKVLLNGAPVAVASTGPIDAQDANREVDLNMFPTELFTQLDVEKSATPSMLEGGASGTVDMRSARPFDHPGAHLTYSLQGTDDSLADSWGQHGSIIASDTWGGTFGVLAGYVGVHNPSRVTGFETIGWTNAGLTVPGNNVTTAQAQCVPSSTLTCNSTGGGNWVIPSTVPASVTSNGLTPGTPINEQFLLAHNPGLTITQIDNALIPRLGRTMDETGDRDRDNGVLSFEYRPSDALHVYVDSLYGREYNNLQRFDMDWVGRSGAMIPLNMQVDGACTNGCVVTQGTFANSQFFLEYRPYKETTDFWGVNPGLEWQISDDWKADVRANDTHSTFHREVPSVLAATDPNADLTVSYVNNGGIPSISSNVDLDNPANFQWNSSARVNIQDERRTTDTRGARFNVTWGHGGPVNVSFGAAWDDISREIMAYDNSQAWQNAVCGDNPSPSVLAPNLEPPCQGLVTATPPAYANGSGYPMYPGLPGGVTYKGSLIPQSALPSYLLPGPDGFITLNWPAFAAASQYALYHGAEPLATASNTGVAGGTIDEKSIGSYFQLEGTTSIADHRLRYIIGTRWVRTHETVGAATSEVSPDNSGLSATTPSGDESSVDGSLVPNTVSLVTFQNIYYNMLPSGELAYNIADNAVVKLAASRTMTRPDPSALLPGASFSDISAETGSLGNPSLKPYISENVDLGLEYYLGGPSYWSVTAFRKRIAGFTATEPLIEPFSYLAQYGITYATLQPSQQTAITERCPGATATAGANSPSCTIVLNEQVNEPGALIINGLEVNYVQSLDPLVESLGLHALDGFGFAFNYTLIDQYGTGAAPQVALDVAPHSYNLSLYYETDALSLRLSTVFNAGSQILGYSQDGIADAAVFSDDYQQWDFSSYFDIPKLFRLSWSQPLQLTFDVTNLTDAHQRTYFQFTNATYTDYDEGRVISVGVRGQF